MKDSQHVYTPHIHASSQVCVNEKGKQLGPGNKLLRWDEKPQCQTMHLVACPRSPLHGFLLLHYHYVQLAENGVISYPLSGNNEGLTETS